MAEDEGYAGQKNEGADDGFLEDHPGERLGGVEIDEAQKRQIP